MKRLFQLCVIASLSGVFVNGQQPDKHTWQDTPVALIMDIYTTVSAKPGVSVDWERVRSMFIDEAVVNEVIPAGQELPDDPEWKF